MARIKKLKDNTDTIIYPITVLAAIYKDENQTVEEWLEELLAEMKNASSTLNTVLATFQQTSQEKLDYYDNLANEALAGVDEELQAILTDVESHATTKKEEITTLTNSEKSEITDLSDNSQNAISTLTNTKKEEITTLANDEKSSITNTATSATNDFTTLSEQLTTNIQTKYNEKSSEFDNIIINFQNKANEALDGEHVTKQVASELGIHGLRVYNEVLSYKNADDEWNEISSGGISVGTTPPEKTNLLWINPDDNILKYYNESSGTWVPTAAVWS